MAIALLTAAQKRLINDYIPSLAAYRPPSFDLGAKLDALIGQFNTLQAAFVTGTAVIATGTNNIAVVLPAALAMGADAYLLAPRLSQLLALPETQLDGLSGTLTITSTAVTTGNRDVSYIVVNA